MRSKLSTIIKTLLLTFSMIFTLVACDSEGPIPAASTTNLIRPAKLLEVGFTSSDDFLNYPAVIQSQQLSTLGFEVSGVLKELLVVEAQRVELGEVLARLDQRDLQAKLNSAHAQFDNANTEYQRAVRLMKEDAIARSVLDQRLSQRDVYKAQLETAEKALQDSVLAAPYEGNIAKIYVREQEVIKAGNPAISILGRGGLEASINLPSSILARSGNQKTPGTLSYIVLDAAPDRRIPAKFKEISLEADAASQTYELRFTFNAPQGLIVLPGMSATVWFKDPGDSSKQVNKASIPLTAIATDGDQKYVWVVKRESMTVTRRNITLEDSIGDHLNVTSGLKIGETIVSAGVSSLSEGMQVRPWSK